MVAGLCVLLAGAARAQDLPTGPIVLAGGRVLVGTEVSLSTSSQTENTAWFNYTDYEHNAMRLMRIGVTTDIRLTDRVSFLGEARSENGDHIRPYAFYVRLRPWKTRPFDLQAGRIPPVFGAFSRRVYAAGNPLIGYPLAYQYLTSLRSDAVPADVDELLRMRARGWRPSYRLGSQEISTGMPLVTAFRWDTGVQVHAGTERMMAGAAITNGTVSDPRGRDNNDRKQVSARVQWQPIAGFLVGASGARGDYLADSVRDLLTSRRSAIEEAMGFDAEYSRGQWLVRGEAVNVRWDVPTIETPLVARSAFLEGRYKILPGVFAAARADRLTFNTVAGTVAERTWDAPVTRVEAGVGAYIRRNLLLRSTYQHNWRGGGLVRNRQQVAFQLQFWM
jgi:hypothetical protein